ncbi:MAG: hypothetical protein ABIP74_04505 [Candidatus Saccharimonas sp.]
MAYFSPSPTELQRREVVKEKAQVFILDRSKHGGANLVFRGDLIQPDGVTAGFTGDAYDALNYMFTLYVTDRARAGIDRRNRERTAVDSAIYHARNFCADVLKMRVSDDPSAAPENVKPGFKLAEVYFRLAIESAERELALPEPSLQTV